MTIVEPELSITKEEDTSQTAINLGTDANFTITAENTGQTDAWYTTLKDVQPDYINGTDTAGTCDTNPKDTLSVGIYEADGTTSATSGPLVENTDYTAVYDPASCTLTVSLISANAVIAPNQKLIIRYTTQLDTDTNLDGYDLINVAGATDWFSGETPPLTETYTTRHYGDPLNDSAHEDSYTLTTALSGYYFSKTVKDITSDVGPIADLSAMPGDKLRYRLRLFNVDQTIDNITISDTLDVNYLDVASFNVITQPANTVVTPPDAITGNMSLTGAAGTPLNIAQKDELIFEYEITLKSPIANNTQVSNQATLFADQGTPADTTDDFTTLSDDPFTVLPPYTNVIADPDVTGDENATVVTVYSPGVAAKVNDQPTAAIGQSFTYTVTVPANPVNIPLYDVHIYDNLAASSAVMHYVDGSAKVLSGQSFVLNNDSGTSTNLELQDGITGIDLLAGEQVVIQFTVVLDNNDVNQAGLSFDNVVSYSYSRKNGSADPQIDSNDSAAATMQVVEPDLTSTKSVAFVSPASKDPLTDSATVGDVLRYTVTIDNTSTATASPAYDLSVVDMLPTNVSLVDGSATASLNDGTTITPISGFILDPDPTAKANGTLIWGQQNGDGSLDIPVGQSLILTYDVTVEAVTGTDIVNTVYADWTSLNNVSTVERNGAGCPSITTPNDYCAGPAQTTVTTQDNTALTKLVSADTYAETPPSTGNPQVRVGDTVTYDLVLHLQEYTTGSVKVTDVLPAGMELVSYTIDPGTTTFNYTPDTTTDPSSGDTGTLTWDFGDIENVPSGDNTPVDDLVIRYVAKVVTDTTAGVAVTPTTQTLTNDASLTYTGYDPANTALYANAPVDVLQPQISTITKTGTVVGPAASGTGTSTDPYVVDIVNNTMDFLLHTCNEGDAPAYGVTITDQLATELNENSVSVTDVNIDGTTTLVDGTDYTYTPASGSGGTLSFVLDNKPLDAGACVNISYSVGFNTDIAPNTPAWSNIATVEQYWSRPSTVPADSREYIAITPVTADSVWMINSYTEEPLSKSVVSPITGEVTIGDLVTYQIKVPANPVNAALDSVVVSDTLHDALLYQNDASAVFNSGASVTLSPTVTGQTVTWGITQIPAGEQVTITFTARVANNSVAQEGVSFTNTAGYTYTGMNDPTQTQGTSGALTIVEPALVIGKTFSNLTNPGVAPNAGDTLEYSVTFTASGGAAGDNYSNAYDLQIDDTLSLGLEYVLGSASVDSGTVTDPASTGDGVTTPQTLVWSLGDGSADIDVNEGTVVTLTYQVKVLDGVLAGQTLSNSATVQWTGQNGVDANERDGAGCPTITPPNDYCDGPASTSQPVLDNTTLTKTRLSDTWGATDSNVRVGDIVEYELRIHLDEGLHTGLVLSDLLPQGLQFDQVVSINGVTSAPYAAASPFSYTAISAPSVSGDPTTGTSTVTWTLGDVTNNGDNNTSNDDFVIIYRAHVLNNDVLPQVNSTTLTNNATLDYNLYTGTTSQTASETVTLLQPNLSVTKSAAPAGGDTIIDANEVITYTVDVINNGAAPAYDTVVQDILPIGLRQGGVSTSSMTLVNAGTGLTPLAPSYDAGTGTVTWNLDSGTADAYTIPAGETLRIVYTVTADPDLGPGLTLSNAVTATNYYSFDDEAVPTAGTVTGAREDYGPSNTASTTLTTLLPGGPLKENPADTNVTIGETFTYTITVPQVAQPTALHDVTIYDDLTALPVDVTVVSIDKLSGSATWTPVNTSGSNNLVIADTANGGIEIPANEQIKIGITLRLDNTTNNNDTNTFANTASYTYDQVDGDTSSQLDGGSSTTGPMTVVEPTLTVTKVATPLSTPITGGSLIEYTVTVDNTGGSTAFDVNVVDTLPPELAFYNGFTPTATIDNNSVTGFVPTPSGAPAGPLVWGRDNADGSLDVPAGSQLVLTYQAQVQVSTAATFSNEVWVDWTSLDGSVYERDGAGCPTTTAPNDYCAGPASASTTITDNNSLAKSVVSDSYVDASSTATDGTLRIGDTVTYRLELSLGEGTTSGVSVTDVLPQGVQFDHVVSVNGDTAAPYSAAAPFSYSDIAAPTVSGDATTGTTTVTWTLGDVTNQANNDGPDTLVIEYQAIVLPDAGIPHVPTTTLTNTATLGYLDGSATPVVDPTRLQDQATITVVQPVMDSLTKTDRLGRIGTSGSPLNVDVTSDTMQFRVESCNTTGQAPAYGIVISDVLQTQLDETSLTAPVVTVGGTVLAAADYVYTPPAGRGGTLNVQLNTPVDPGQCVTVDYDIGFYTDFGPNQTWNNSVTLDEYWSLPLSSGQQYSPLGPAAFYMTNQVGVTPLSKSLVSPASEITVGELVTYKIVVPATPVNAALDNVLVSDSLHGALLYQNDASGVFNSGAAATLSETVSGQDITWDITQIPAGEQVTITYTARVDNNSQANAGVSFTNTAGYTYTGMTDPTLTQATSAALTIVEPELVIGKTVTNKSNPGVAPAVGDILHYEVTFTASGGAAGDNFSNAFELQINDTLSLGLLYVNGSATVGGSGNTISDPATNGGDGITTAQALIWSLGDGSADIDVVEGSIVTVSYDVEVLSSASPGQELTNSATVQWTGLDGVNTYERNGTGTPVENDYFTGPATTTLTSQFAVTYTKSVVNMTTGQDPGADASPGDTLQYTLTIKNESVATLTNAAVVDELAAEFVPGTLNLVSVSDTNADSSNTSGTGGTNGTGVVDVRGITLAPSGTAGDTVTIVFTATLAPVIPNGTDVVNEAQLTGDSLPATTSNQTLTHISSAPVLEVWKSSADLNGGLLQPGDTLRYTITVKNTGNEDATGVTLTDLIPTFTTYKSGTTRLNGSVVSDSALVNGLLINSPADTTPGAMPVGASTATNTEATITFDVVVNSDVVAGTIISNQGFVNGSGAGGTAFPETPTDDPATSELDDPTLNIVGDLPLIDAQKSVALVGDVNGNGYVDDGDTLRYTITVYNRSTVPATGTVLTDTVPQYTNYLSGTTTLNGNAVSDVAGGLPLIGGMSVNSPGAVTGTIDGNSNAVVTFDVQVTGNPAPDTAITNQGSVTANELSAAQLTDGDPSAAGQQPTVIYVGQTQQLSITKQVTVKDGGVALPGSVLVYEVQVRNTGSIPATNVVITDDLTALASVGIASPVSNATMNGSTSGVTVSNPGPVITADYSATYGDLAPNATVTLRFYYTLNTSVSVGTVISNTAQVDWNTPIQSLQASVDLAVGSIPGYGSLSGQVWHDSDPNHNKTVDSGESTLAGWTVRVYQNNVLKKTVTTQSDGTYLVSGLPENDITGGIPYELRFTAPGAGANTASMGMGDASSVSPVNSDPSRVPVGGAPQRITNVYVGSSVTLYNLNLPITPNGVVYDSMFRTPIAGAQLYLTQGGANIDSACFEDPAQQGQVTLASGFYKFDLKTNDPSCPTGDYEISVTPPASGYAGPVSTLIPPSPISPYDVASCSADALSPSPSAGGYCEAQTTDSAPTGSGTPYYLTLTFTTDTVADSQIFNNHIPLDPTTESLLSITKTSSLVNVSRGELVPYTITVTNTTNVNLTSMTIVDTFPAGFKYVEGSSRINGKAVEPTMTNRQLIWAGQQIDSGKPYVMKLLFIVGAGVGEGKYVNRANATNVLTGDTTGDATATVRVIPDPTFDCTDAIGKVFDDKNLNGVQDKGETGLQGVRLVTARGLIVTTDQYGRFHITCAVVPNESRGSNYILKLDDRSLPSGYRVTTENPRVLRATQGKMMKFDFGAAIHHVVRLDVADGVFEPGTTTMRQQWVPRIGLLLEQLKKSPSVLRLSYLADVEEEELVNERVAALKKAIAKKWEELNCCYKLTIETEIYWRRGAPPERSDVID